MCQRQWRRLDPVLARALRLVESPVGGRDQLLGLRQGRRRGDAEARGDPDRRAARGDDHALLQGGPHPLGDVRGACGVGAGKEQHELLAAEAPGGVDLLAHALAQQLGEGADDRVPGRMAVHVVDRLEVVEVGEDERRRSAHALGADELGLELVLAVAPVGEPGEAVDERLPLDDAVQAGVLERDGGLGGERPRGLLALVVEGRAVEDERAEAVRARGGERELERVVAGGRVARLDHVARPAEQHGTVGAGRVHDGLDDDAHQLVRVVRRGEGGAEARERLAQARALRLELVEAALQLLPPSC